MTNKYFHLGFLALVFIFGMGFLSCNSGNQDNKLNGTWASAIMGYDVSYYFNNGNFEASMNNIAIAKGTYTTDSGQIAMEITHFYNEEYSLWESKDEIFMEIKEIIAEREDKSVESVSDESVLFYFFGMSLIDFYLEGFARYSFNVVPELAMYSLEGKKLTVIFGGNTYSFMKIN